MVNLPCLLSPVRFEKINQNETRVKQRIAIAIRATGLAGLC